MLNIKTLVLTTKSNTVVHVTFKPYHYDQYEKLQVVVNEYVSRGKGKLELLSCLSSYKIDTRAMAREAKKFKKNTWYTLLSEY